MICTSEWEPDKRTDPKGGIHNRKASECANLGSIVKGPQQQQQHLAQYCTEIRNGYFENS
jgi:hypothetical protein